MSLSRIFSPGQSMKLTLESNATGWVNALNGGGVYYFGSGVVRITVTAKNVDGVKILDWDKDQYRSPEVTANADKYATITAMFDLGSRGRVVTRFLNPQADAEGIMTVETAPPPRVLAGFTAFLRRWRHGAKQDRPHRGDREWHWLGSQEDRQCGGTENRRAGLAAVDPHPVRPHKHDLRRRVSPIQHQLIHAPRSSKPEWIHHPAGIHRQSLRNHHLHRLAAVGGGA